MRILFSALMISTLVLTGCGTVRDSRLNPFNWFGKSRAETRVVDGQEVNPLIPRQRESIFRPERKSYQGSEVDQITAMVVERTTGGAIIRVSGLPQRQGVYDVRLTSDTDREAVDGVLEFTLRALQPQNQPQGSESQRTITAAVFVSDQELEGVRLIRVKGARNARTSRR